MDLHENTRLFELFSLPSSGDGLKSVQEAVAARIGASAESKDVSAIAAKLAAFKSDTLVASLRQMLNLDVFGIFVGAWRQLDDVHQAAVKSLAPPCEEQKVDLAKHKLEAKLRPRLVVSLHGVDLCDLEFEVCLTADVTTAKLFIANGELTAILPGPVTGSVALTMLDHELKKWDQDFKLLSTYKFARPWVLQGAGASQSPSVNTAR
jgi:hypothetical protein